MIRTAKIVAAVSTLCLLVACGGSTEPPHASAAPDAAALWEFVDRAAQTTPLTVSRVEGLLGAQLKPGDGRRWVGGQVSLGPEVTVLGTTVSQDQDRWIFTVFTMNTSQCVNADAVKSRYPDLAKLAAIDHSDPTNVVWFSHQPWGTLRFGLSGQPQCVKTIRFDPPQAQ
ncbi:Uncharacterised protein [Mycobacteroides abscessus]|nr:Uncharacterised protein [Mycobacteroides abscessus]CPX06034.1 Uncharacterised protein [Mycobacteroides abscessus]CQA08729.1 Uncharacterised protein [Mycobacteroides abscessus]